MVLNRQNILSLYRRCLKSAQRIPETNQRLTFLDYVRDGFRRKKHFALNSREAILAYQDGIDQVTDMEYYQRMAKAKHEVDTHKINFQQVTTNMLDKVIVQSQEQESLDKSSTSEVLAWILSQLPHLHKEDAVNYSNNLVNDGFDSVPFILEEISEDDLVYMKKAHRRVLMRQIEKLRNDNSNTNT